MLISTLVECYPVTQACILSLTAVDCGSLTNPANGQVSHTAGTKFGEIAIYSCEPGYNLVGDSTRTCQATGEWSGSEPTCQGVLLKCRLHFPKVLIS